MTVADGVEVDLGPFPRFDNAYCYRDFDDLVTDIVLDDQRLELDFDQNRRRYWADATR